MRISTGLIFGLAAMMVAMPSEAAAVSPLKMMKEVKTRLAGGNSAKRNVAQKNAGEVMRMSELAKKMKPGTTKTFGWDGEDWMPEDTYTYNYDAAGNVTIENAVDAEGYCSRTQSEYYSDGMLKSKITTVSEDGVNFENYSKTEFEYDPVLTGVITMRSEWLWLDGEWQQIGNNYKRIITRDAQGNITSTVIAVLFQGIYDPTQKVEVVYGADGKASEISEHVLGYDYASGEYTWEESTRFSNIVWNRTDGQIYDVEQIVMGSNRIASAHIEDSDDLEGDIAIEYADDSDAYTLTISAIMEGMPATAKAEYIPLENDGYIQVSATYFMGQEMFSSREECRYDDWGLMTLMLESETEDGEEYGERMVGEVEYDSEGKPAVYTVSQTFIDSEMEMEETDYVIRAEYSDYVDVTSGSGLIMAGDGAETYYNLQGMPVAAPEKGQIVVTASGAKKKF